MARYLGPTCRLCRREKTKLFLKGPKCETLKCPITRRPYPPGEHGRERLRPGSEYQLQLREKQKARRTYGVSEAQFVNYYKAANRQSGITGETILKLLESRLDNIVFRAGWAASRSQGRQFVRHNLVLLNGKKVNVPSLKVKVGDEISLSPRAKNFIIIRHNLDTFDRAVPLWLNRSEDKYSVVVTAMPERDQIDAAVKEQLIVELYSK